MIKINKSLVISSLLLLPRGILSYPIYIISSLFNYNINDRKSVESLIRFLLIIITFYFLNSIVYSVSISAMLIQITLTLPLLFFISGFKFWISASDIKKNIRLLNIGILVLSIISMTKQGFPLKLPYINFAPDYYNAFYGLGGAKIVTIIGFFGILFEIGKKDKNKILFIVISTLNFTTPSYLLGFISGIFALTLIIRNKIYLSLIGVLIFNTMLGFILERYNTLGFISIYDFPKIMAIEAVIKMYVEYPTTFFIGSGIGQFSSTTAFWANKFIASLSTHSIPNIPFFYNGEIHLDIYNDIFSRFLGFWDISSASQKPYSSINSIYSEFGLLFGTYIYYLVGSRILHSLGHNFEFYCILTFLFLITFLDMVHDNIFLVTMLAFYCEYKRKLNSE